MDKLGYLSRINIMEVLPPEALAEVAQVAPMNAVKKGKSIMEPNQRPNVLFLLKEGRVRIFKLNADGKRFTTALLGPGNIFDEVAAFPPARRTRTPKRLTMRCSVC